MRRGTPSMRCASCTVLLFMMSVSSSAAKTPTPTSVTPFKSICALTTQKIEDFIVCTQLHCYADNRGHIAEEFNRQVKQVGSLSRSEVVKMVCRTVGDDSSVIMGEYLDGLGSEADYILSVLKKCGYIG